MKHKQWQYHILCIVNLLSSCKSIHLAQIRDYVKGNLASFFLFINQRRKYKHTFSFWKLDRDKIRQCREGKSTALVLSMSEGGKNLLPSHTAHNHRPFHIFIFSQQHKYISHTKPWGEITREKLHRVIPQLTTWLSDLPKLLFQYHPSQNIRCRFNGSRPSCCHSWEQDWALHVLQYRLQSPGSSLPYSRAM